MRQRAFKAMLFLFITALVAAGVATLASAPESPAPDDPPISGDYERVTLQVAGMT